MNLLDKRRILAMINEIPSIDLLEHIHSGSISLEEMIDAGLEPSAKKEIEDQFATAQDKKEKRNKIGDLCVQIDKGEVAADEIKRYLETGKITESDLLNNTSLTAEELDKIKHYHKTETRFYSWNDLPPLKSGRTDVYFFGQPGSGKSCILAGLFYYFNQNGLLVEDVTNIEGTRYRNELAEEISYGILPHSTAREGVNYIPIELRDPENNERRHPLNFIEMSGELFVGAYRDGISEDNIAAKNYLTNDNKKLIFFVVDYEQDQKRVSSSKTSQASMVQFTLEALDNMKILEKTDAVYILISKADLFPAGVDKTSFANDYFKSRYLNFHEMCRDKRKKYNDLFSVMLYPFTIGEVKFKNLLTRFDEESSRYVTKAIIKHSFANKRPGIFGTFFKS